MTSYSCLVRNIVKDYHGSYCNTLEWICVVSDKLTFLRIEPLIGEL